MGTTYRHFVEIELTADCTMEEAIDALQKDVEKASELYKVILSFKSLGGLVRSSGERHLQSVEKRLENALEVYEWLNGKLQNRRSEYPPETAFTDLFNSC